MLTSVLDESQLLLTFSGECTDATSYSSNSTSVLPDSSELQEVSLVSLAETEN